jgi:hypothetical protein
MITHEASLRFGTDLLSHPLASGQYHRLWWANFSVKAIKQESPMITHEALL